MGNTFHSIDLKDEIFTINTIDLRKVYLPTVTVAVRSMLDPNDDHSIYYATRPNRTARSMNMPIIDHNAVPEVQWRPGYRTRDLSGPSNGMSTTLSYAMAEVGAGAPLHHHEDEELIVVLEGTVEARIKDEVCTIGADHTLAIPANVPHAFTVVGDCVARLLVYFPVPDPFDRTIYLEGSPPE